MRMDEWMVHAAHYAHWRPFPSDWTNGPDTEWDEPLLFCFKLFFCCFCRGFDSTRLDRTESMVLVWSPQGFNQRPKKREKARESNCFRTKKRTRTEVSHSKMDTSSSPLFHHHSALGMCTNWSSQIKWILSNEAGPILDKSSCQLTCMMICCTLRIQWPVPCSIESSSWFTLIHTLHPKSFPLILILLRQDKNKDNLGRTLARNSRNGEWSDECLRWPPLQWTTKCFEHSASALLGGPSLFKQNKI